MEEYKPIVVPAETSLEGTHKDNAQTAMIFGILSAALAWVPLLSILAIIFGAMAVSRANKNKKLAQDGGFKENGMNVAAFVTGLVGIIAGAFMTLVYALAIVCLVLFTVGVVEYGAPYLSMLG